ncbi:MAG TPA: MFS transporter [Intrasporangiaceae bacterium]|nr:MFS transporter [Intrasporangiaceae bacterium]
MSANGSGPGRLPASARRGYALGSVATGAFGTVPGLLLLPYLTDRLGIAAGLAGLIVFLPKAWDTILNPIAGRISDRSTNPQGRRRPFLLKAGVALAICFALIFLGPSSPRGLAATWVVVTFLACATAFAFFQVPYVSMPAEMTDDYDERTRLMTWRVAILALAILVSGGVSPAIRDALPIEWGYRAVGVFVAALILLGAFGAWRGTRGIAMRSFGQAGGSLGEQLRIVAGARNFRLLLITFVIQALAVGAMLAGVDYVARVRLGAAGMSTALFVAFVGPALLVTPLWQKFGERYDKRLGYIISSVLLGGGALLTLVTMQISAAALTATAAVVGIGYAGAQMFPLAMLPDNAAVDGMRTGENRVGVYTGVWTAGETFGLALGPLLYAAVLSAGGYISSTDGLAQQPDSALTAIAWGFAVVPAVLIAVSFFTLVRYRLDEDEVRAAIAATSQGSAP